MRSMSSNHFLPLLEKTNRYAICMGANRTLYLYLEYIEDPSELNVLRVLGIPDSSLEETGFFCEVVLVVPYLPLICLPMIDHCAIE